MSEQDWMFKRDGEPIYMTEMRARIADLEKLYFDKMNEGSTKSLQIAQLERERDQALSALAELREHYYDVCKARNEFATNASRYRWVQREMDRQGTEPPLCLAVWKKNNDRRAEWVDIGDGAELSRLIDAARAEPHEATKTTH